MFISSRPIPAFLQAYLGASTGTYLNPSLRGLESGIDSVSVSGATLTVAFSADIPGDYVQVLVEGDVPAVPSLALPGLGVTLMLTVGLGVEALRRPRGKDRG